MMKANKGNKHFLGVRVSDVELKAIDVLVKHLERKRSDAVRYVLRQAAQEIERNASKGAARYASAS